MDEKQLVSEFMGYEYINEDVFLETYDLAKDDTSHLMVDRAAEQYKTDWNWLMGVIAEIQSVCNEEGLWEVAEYEHLAYYLIGANIENTFNHVVKFIEWYNNNQDL